MTSPVDRLMDSLEWTPTGATPGQDGLPYATHTGVLMLGEMALRCYQLSNGQRVLDAKDLAKMFDGVIDFPSYD